MLRVGVADGRHAQTIDRDCSDMDWVGKAFQLFAWMTP
jgi:hypothetical protein